MIWVSYHDMNSGGRRKEEWGHIYIECDSIEQGNVIFYNTFGHNPNRVTCTCCGEDYLISSDPDLAQLTGYERGCNVVNDDYVEEQSTEKWAKPYQTLEQYLPTVKVIYNKDIPEEKKTGIVPGQGYVWME